MGTSSESWWVLMFWSCNSSSRLASKNNTNSKHCFNFKTQAYEKFNPQSTNEVTRIGGRNIYLSRSEYLSITMLPCEQCPLLVKEKSCSLCTDRMTSLKFQFGQWPQFKNLPFGSSSILDPFRHQRKYYNIYIHTLSK